MSRIRAILFDKDGTLLDFNATWLGFVKEIAMEAAGGIADQSDLLLEAVGYDHSNQSFRAGSAVAAGTTVDIIASMYPDASEDERRTLAAKADRQSAIIGRDRAVPLPGVIDALGVLHTNGYRLGLATNDATEGAEATLLAFGVAHLFDAAYGYDAVANPKPAPDVLFAFADTVDMHPSNVAMVGDNTHDLEAARSAGAGLSIGVLTGNSGHAELNPLADVIVDSVADLPAYFASRID